MAKRVGGSALNDVIVLLVTSRDSASVMEYCTKNYGLKASDSEKLVKEAQKRIVLAADYDRREEIGRAVIRFDAIYEECIKSSDSKTALSANIGKCRLLGLYEKEGQVDRTDVGNDREKQLDAVRNHLEPILRVPQGVVPIPELARLAALEILKR